MIQTLNIPYSPSSSSSKTDEIMSRYRPIAPKPELPNNNSTNSSNATTNTSSYDSNNNGSLVPEKFRQSPYLRNIWSHLQARPTRTRKRGRSSAISPTAAAALLRKQQHQQQQHHQHQQYQPTFMGLCSARNLSMQAFGMFQHDIKVINNNNNNDNNNNNNDNVVNHENDKINNNNNNNCCNKNNVVELPLLCCPMLSSKPIDLNSVAVDVVVPSSSSSMHEETDLQLKLQLQLQVSTTTTNTDTASIKEATKGVIISPRPVRPVGSTITIVGPISEDPNARALVRAPEQVEAEVEEEALPAVISDRGNKVRMANSAYKELIGQPECPWLDTMCTGGRISGEVMLVVPRLPSMSSNNGFSCWVRIEWESSNGKKNLVNAFCDVVKLVCLSKDYLYQWRFHTREVSPSTSKVV